MIIRMRLVIVLLVCAQIQLVAQERVPQPDFSWHEWTHSDDLQLAVDTRWLPQHGLVFAQLRVPVTGGKDFSFRYPRWVPGIHAPKGPVQNIGGLMVHSEQGERVPWRRDSEDLWRFHAQAPAASTAVIISLTYMANNQSTNSHGIDVHAWDEQFVFNWNTVLLVPDGIHIDAHAIRAQLQLPANFSWGSNLTAFTHSTAQHVQFKPVSVAKLIDSPLIAGKHLRRIPLTAAGADETPVFLNICGTKEQSTRPPAAWLQQLQQLPVQTERLFGGAHYDQYSFLLSLGRDRFGLEHHCSSLNGFIENEITLPGTFADMTLLPHEFAHSWVGKYRRPAGMVTHNYHSTKQLDGLWVYEGLTTHLGNILAVRSGLVSREAWLHDMAQTIVHLRDQPGRSWRSIRDTARSSWQLREWATHWNDLRRHQDYYIEGALWWLGADIIIREQTNNEKSLDDFCAAFFGPHQSSRAFTEYELVAALNEVCPYDWAGRIRRGIDEVGPLDLSFLQNSGWHLREGVTTDIDRDSVHKYWTPTLEESLFGIVHQHGWVTRVVPDSVAAQAGIRVDDYIYSAAGIQLDERPAALGEAILTANGSKIRLKIYRNENWLTKSIVKPVGIPLARLTRVTDQPDRLTPIVLPRTATGPVMLPQELQAAPSAP